MTWIFPEPCTVSEGTVVLFSMDSVGWAVRELWSALLTTKMKVGAQSMSHPIRLMESWPVLREQITGTREHKNPRFEYEGGQKTPRFPLSFGNIDINQWCFSGTGCEGAMLCFDERRKKIKKVGAQSKSHDFKMFMPNSRKPFDLYTNSEQIFYAANSNMIR